MSRPGRLAIVLHTHMPYVEGVGSPWPFGEEWLWEAIATSYVPLLALLCMLLWRRARLFYAEHLVFALHTQAQLLLAFVLVLASGEEPALARLEELLRSGPANARVTGVERADQINDPRVPTRSFDIR